MQSTFENACVRDLRECNRIVEYATSTSTRGVCFFPDFALDDAVVVTISNASFYQEQEQIDGVTHNFKSQQACITALAPGNALNAEKMLIHPLSWSSTRIRRVCRSTWQKLTHCPMLLNMDYGRDHRMRGQLTIRWEETASAAMGHVWFTDCDFSQHQTVDHKRPAIVLSALEQLIWDNRDDCDEEVDGSKGDYHRWIDASAML